MSRGDAPRGVHPASFLVQVAAVAANGVRGHSVLQPGRPGAMHQNGAGHVFGAFSGAAYRAQGRSVAAVGGIDGSGMVPALPYLSVLLT